MESSLAFESWRGRYYIYFIKEEHPILQKNSYTLKKGPELKLGMLTMMKCIAPTTDAEAFFVELKLLSTATKRNFK